MMKVLETQKAILNSLKNSKGKNEARFDSILEENVAQNFMMRLRSDIDISSGKILRFFGHQIKYGDAYESAVNNAKMKYIDVVLAYLEQRFEGFNDSTRHFGLFYQLAAHLYSPTLDDSLTRTHCNKSTNYKETTMELLSLY